jgi:hypothetical protein
MEQSNIQEDLREKSDHDLLIITVTELKQVKKILGNHLEHAHKRELLYLSVLLGGVITVMLSLAGILYAFLGVGVTNGP